MNLVSVRERRLVTFSARKAAGAAGAAGVSSTAEDQQLDDACDCALLRVAAWTLAPDVGERRGASAGYRPRWFA